MQFGSVFELLPMKSPLQFGLAAGETKSRRAGSISSGPGSPCAGDVYMAVVGGAGPSGPGARSDVYIALVRSVTASVDWQEYH